ncbi:MAG TPA: polysaccharide lyase family 4 protein [Bryobacteraceae bacterium]|nr:polysaccharide lyase family 4 protein [Bryobacteraceae bacterium]
MAIRTLLSRRYRSALRAAIPLAAIPLVIFSVCAVIGTSAPENSSGASGVTLTQDDLAYTLSNGTVEARINKKSGDLVSLRYNGTEMLATILKPDGLPDITADPPGANLRGGGHRYTDHQFGFWSHDTDGPHTSSSITIDPKSNGGARAEVSVKGISDGRPMGAGPGGSFISDIEIRYALGRNEPGVYTYSIFTHQPSYPASILGEARFCTKLNSFFDWMSISATQNHLYPKENGEHEDKYDFTVNQYDNRAFGWSSREKNLGFWFINPSVEYLSGGPTKVEFEGHRDTNQVAAPCVLNYWRSSHYGGANVDVAQGEQWTKVIGPFFLYCNRGANPQAMYTDAKAEAAKETRKWPYDWVSGIDYPHRDERATVKGEIVLKDPQMPRGDKVSHMMVGLAYPAYVSPVSRPNGPPPRHIDWQTDAKHYEFWVRADEHGRFSIPEVRPGNYTLHAFADGVLGEYAKADVTVAPGKSMDLGKLEWTPVRYGKQLWEIGIPNRTGSEFLKGDAYNHDGMGLLYAKLFPNDVNYVVGKSDFRKDWYFEQVPHSENPDVKFSSYNRGLGNGRATPWSITFNLPQAPHGKATLRLALAGTGTRVIDVSVNDQPAGKVDGLTMDGALARNGIMGVWNERDFTFDASLMKQGTNVMKLTIPAGSVTAGIIYDYLRLELE